MIVRKTLSLKSMHEFAGHHIWWLTTWMSLVTIVYYCTGCKLILFPWLPLSLVGTAVAFYVGFKNNQSYGRLWEARRLWDEITGQSRQLAVMVKNYRSEEAVNQDESNSIRQQIIFRHIAYIYQLRKQLLEPAIWEHVSLCRS